MIQTFFVESLSSGTSIPGQHKNVQFAQVYLLAGSQFDVGALQLLSHHDGIVSKISHEIQDHQVIAVQYGQHTSTQFSHSHHATNCFFHSQQSRLYQLSAFTNRSQLQVSHTRSTQLLETSVPLSQHLFLSLGLADIQSLVVYPFHSQHLL
jgi:hypothetical protein